MHPSSAILVAVPKVGSFGLIEKERNVPTLLSGLSRVRHAGGAGLLFWERIPFMLCDILISEAVPKG